MAALSTALDAIEKRSIESSSAVFVFDTWPQEIHGAGTPVYALQSRSGAGTAILGYLDTLDAGSHTITILADPQTLLLLAPALNQFSTSRSNKASILVHVAAKPNDFHYVLAAAALLSDSSILFSGASVSETLFGLENAVGIAREGPGGLVINAFDGLQAAWELAPSTSAEQSSAFHGSANATSLVVIPASLQASTAIAALEASNNASTAILALASLASIHKLSIPAAIRTVHVYTPPESSYLLEVVLGKLSKLSSPPIVLPLSVSADWSIKEWATILANPSSSTQAALPHLQSLASDPAKMVSFWSSDSGTASTLPRTLAETFASNATSFGNGIKPRLATAYDNTAGGKSVNGLGLQNSTLLLSLDSVSHPLSAIAATTPPSLLYIADPAFIIHSYDPLSTAGPSTQILFTSNWSEDDFNSKLSDNAKNAIIKRGGTGETFTLNVDAIAQSLNIPADQTGVFEQAAFWILYLAFGKQVQQEVEALVASLLVGAGENALEIVNATRAGLKIVRISQVNIQVNGIGDPVAHKGEQDQSTISLPATIQLASISSSANAFKDFPEEQPSSFTTSHTAIKHLMFPEAYNLPAAGTEDTLRPDLPEQNFLVTVTENRRLTPLDYDRNVFHLEMSTAGTGLKYAVGEALGVHGHNDTQEVLDFIEWFGATPDTLISVPSRTNHRGAIEQRTLFQVLQQNLDIFGKPPKSFFEALSKYATSREEARHLRFIGSAEGSSTFRKWSEDETVTYADVLRAFPSAKENFGVEGLLREVLPLKPRHYSIASSQNFVGDSVHLLVVTVDWMNTKGQQRFGQCTRYLAALKPGDKVMVSVKPSVMKLPPNDKAPIIMAGLGTGAAPFRAFIQERAYQLSKGIEVGPLLYYFGARYRSAEYLYGEELEAYVKDGVITHTGLAFSRDTKHKVYIQHRMQNDADKLVEAFKNDGYFYLCGPTWPVPDVYEALLSAFKKDGQSEEEAQAYLEELKEEEKYVLEVY